MNSERETEGDMSRGGGRDHWGGMSHPENPAHGVSLSALWCPLCRADAIWNATEQGVEGLRETPKLKGDGYG